MARLSMDPPRSSAYRMGAWFSRRQTGEVIDPVKVLGHNPKVLGAYGRFEGKVAKWDRLDKRTRDLADLATAAAVGCSWCLDFGYWALHNAGVSREKIEAVSRGERDSVLFDPLERLVLRYADAVSATPPEVTDELVAELRTHLDEAELVELTMVIAVENLRSRFNSAMGLTGQGFKEKCDLPSSAQQR